MSNQLQVIGEKLKSEVTYQRVSGALGFSDGDKRGLEEAKKYAMSVYREIERTVGDGKKDLSLCTPQSIVGSMIDAASFKLPIDGRQLAHMVKYGNKAAFQPGYRGYLFKLSEYYDEVDYTASIVYQGDDVDMQDDNGYQTYTHKRKNIFESDESKIVGLICAVRYKTGGKQCSKVEILPKSEIDKIRKTAKQDFIWSAWFTEKAKAAGLKRLCKIHFSNIMGLQDLVNYDNEHHHDINAERSHNAEAVAQSVQQEMQDAGEVIEHEPLQEVQELDQDDNLIDATASETAMPDAPEEIVFYKVIYADGSSVDCETMEEAAIELKASCEFPPDKDKIVKLNQELIKALIEGGHDFTDLILEAA